MLITLRSQNTFGAIEFWWLSSLCYHLYMNFLEWHITTVVHIMKVVYFQISQILFQSIFG